MALLVDLKDMGRRFLYFDVIRRSNLASKSNRFTGSVTRKRSMISEGFASLTGSCCSCERKARKRGSLTESFSMHQRIWWVFSYIILVSSSSSSLLPKCIGYLKRWVCVHKLLPKLMLESEGV